MPTLDVSKKDFEKLVGKKFRESELEEALEYVKGEIDGIDGDNLKVDCKETNRPDLWSTEGLAREISARIGKEKGIRKYEVKKSNVEVIIDKNLKNVRPLIACAIVKDVKITEDFLIQMIQLQEKVGDTFGRKRKETGIGLYDLDTMTPPIYYKGFKDKEIEFIPLEWKLKMRPSEILTQHEKGKQYGHLLENNNIYPIVIDSENVVASMPPIINSMHSGKVTEKTKNLFLEVTGQNWEVVSTALEVMTMALADRGGKIYSVKTKFPKDKFYPKKDIYSPEFYTKKINFEKSQVEKITGLKLKDNEIKKLLENARYNVKINKKNIEVEYPSYRKDIFHAVDVIEDLLISYGYNNIEPEKISMDVKGSELDLAKKIDFVREACIGAGLLEVMTFNLSSIENAAKKMNLEEEKDNFVEIENPVSSNYQIMRSKLTPNLLNFLAKNKGVDFPQKIFELGTTLELDKNAKNGLLQKTKLCVLITHTNVNFTEIKSVLCSILEYIGTDYKFEKAEYKFLSKNSAKVVMNEKSGFLGELNKKIEENFNLKKPVCLFEIEI